MTCSRIEKCKEVLISTIQHYRRQPSGNGHTCSNGLALHRIARYVTSARFSVGDLRIAMQALVADENLLVAAERIISSRAADHKRRTTTVVLDLDLLPEDFDFSASEIILNESGESLDRRELGISFLNPHSSILHTCYKKMLAYIPHDGLPNKVKQAVASLSN